MSSQPHFSTAAQQSLNHAEELARSYGHGTQNTAHLLVGVMMTERSLGADAMASFDLPVPVARVYLKRLAAPQELDQGPIPRDASFEQALEQAADEARWLASAQIDTEHLLLGITRTNLGSAIELLRLVAITPEQIRRSLRRLINAGTTAVSFAELRASAKLSELSKRVLNAAEQNVRRYDDHDVGLGHLLLALGRERRGVTAPFLRQSNFTVGAVEADLMAHGDLSMVDATGVMSAAISLAEHYGSHYVGADHLLLALAQSPDGAHLLRQSSADVEKIKRLLDKHFMN